MVKKIEGFLKFQVLVGFVILFLFIGLVFGQCGLNIMEFCKVFNVQIQDVEKGVLCLIVIIYYFDKFFMFEVKMVLVSFFLKKVVKLQKGFFILGCGIVVFVSKVQVKEIVEVKMKDLNVNDIDVVMLMVEGFVCFMGFEVME